MNELFDYLKDHMAIVGGLAVGVAVIQVTIKRQFFSMSRIFDKKRSKPKIFLAYH